jgi:hypothetical protein
MDSARSVYSKFLKAIPKTYAKFSGINPSENPKRALRFKHYRKMNLQYVP